MNTPGELPIYFWVARWNSEPPIAFFWRSVAHQYIADKFDWLERNQKNGVDVSAADRVSNMIYDDTIPVMQPILVNRDLVGRRTWDREWKLVDRLVHNIRLNMAEQQYKFIGPLVPYYLGTVTAFQTECVVMLSQGETQWRTICTVNSEGCGDE